MGGSGRGPRAPLTGPLNLQLWASARPTRYTRSAARPACRPAPTRSIAAPASAPSAASAQKVRPPPSQDPQKEPRAGPPTSHPRLGARTCGPRCSTGTCPREGSASLCQGWSSPSGSEAAAGQGLPPRGQHPGRGRAEGGGSPVPPQAGEGSLGRSPRKPLSCRDGSGRHLQKLQLRVQAPVSLHAQRGGLRPWGGHNSRLPDLVSAGPRERACRPAGGRWGPSGSHLSPTAGAQGATGSVRSGPAHGAVPWRAAPSSPRSMPGPTASTAPAPTFLSR